MSTIRCDVVVIGAGAAGLMTAITAGERGRQVQVIDHANKVGKKILMSGGGRCNFTNTGTTSANFLSANPHSANRRGALHALALHRAGQRTASPITKKELGQLFQRHLVQADREDAVDECQAAGAQIRTECSVQRIEHGSDGFRVHTTQACSTAPRWWLPPALSIPSMAPPVSARNCPPVRPPGAADPRRAGPADAERQAPGSGWPTQRRRTAGRGALQRKEFQNFMLLTHRGVSGPAIRRFRRSGSPAMRWSWTCCRARMRASGCAR